MRSRTSFRRLFMLTSPSMVQNLHERVARNNNHQAYGVKRDWEVTGGGNWSLGRVLHLRGIFVVFPSQHGYFPGFHVLQLREDTEQHLPTLLDGGFGEVLGQGLLS